MIIKFRNVIFILIIFQEAETISRNETHAHRVLTNQQQKRLIWYETMQKLS